MAMYKTTANYLLAASNISKIAASRHCQYLETIHRLTLEKHLHILIMCLGELLYLPFFISLVIFLKLFRFFTRLVKRLQQAPVYQVSVLLRHILIVYFFSLFQYIQQYGHKNFNNPLFACFRNFDCYVIDMTLIYIRMKLR